MSKVRRKLSRGQELVEFAITLPILILLIMGIFDLGRAVYYYSALQNAVREGARYGIIREDSAAVRTDITNVVRNYAIALDPAALNVSIPSWTDAFLTVRGQYRFTPVTPLIGAFLQPTGEILLVSSSTMHNEY